ncbi:isoflavone reductase family protein [Colletotrichum incanum]|nr:isoflavone reductase family protein [Colletotrichum incanum]
MALEEQKEIAEAAIKASIKRLIPSEYGPDSSSDDVVAAVPFFQPKKAHLEWLATKEDQISRAAIITGPFFDWGLRLGMTGFDLANKTIGKAIIAIIQQPAETKNQLVFVESFTTTQVEILAVLEKLIRQKWKVNEIGSQDVRQYGFAKLDKGKLVEGRSAVIMALVLGDGGLEDHTHVKDDIWNQRLGLKAESVEKMVKEALGL